MLGLLLLVSLTYLVSCTEESKIEEQEQVVIIPADTLVFNDTNEVILNSEPGITDFILVRHAEKSSIGTDPVLTTVGTERADRLASILTKVSLGGVYSSDFNRTRLTASPTAESQGLTIINYDALDHDGTIKRVLENQKGNILLIVGHSNTVPSFLNALTGTMDYPELDESAYDNLYIVRTKEIGDADVLALKY